MNNFLNNLYKLEGKTAYITGGAQGIGYTVAKGFANCGVNIAIVDQNLEKAETVAQEIEKLGVSSIAVKADVTSQSDVDKMIDTIVKKFGSLDIAVNNAGIGKNVESESIEYEDWQKVIDVNLAGVFLTARAAGRYMISKGKGSIINTASMSGHIVNRPQPQSAYNASKAGVIMLTKSLAVEWASKGVRVNCISPGYIETELTVHQKKEWIDSWMDQSVMPRLGQTEDLVGAYLYLAGEASLFTTGTDIVVDGGFTSV